MEKEISWDSFEFVKIAHSHKVYDLFSMYKFFMWCSQ